jgi:cytochrome P450
MERNLPVSTISDPPAPDSGASPGTLYNPMVPPHREDPHSIFDRLRREEPVAYSPLFNMWLVSRYDDVHEMVKDHRRFTTEGAFNKLSAVFQPEAWALLSQSHAFSALNLVVSEKEHARLRGPVHKFFGPQQINQHEPMIQRRASALMDRFPSASAVDLVEQFAYPLPLQVILDLVGVPYADQPAIRQGVEAVLACMFTVPPAEKQVETVRQVLGWEEYLIDLIARRRANPRDDLISTLVQSIDSGQARLSLPELVSTLSIIIVAGHDTTVKAIGNSLHFLLTNRQHWQALIDDPSLIPRAAEELLRLDPVVLGFFRTAAEPVGVRGVTIPAGAACCLLYASANHDPERFPRPNEYNPHRPNLNEHVAFGHGLHFCLGAYLARLQLRVALELLTTQLPGLRLVPDQEITHSSNITLRGLDHLLATVSADTPATSQPELSNAPLRGAHQGPAH